MLKFIKTGDAKGTRVDIDLPAGRWAFLKIAIEGTTDAGQTLTPSDLGDYRLERNGREIHGVDLRFTHEYADLKNGHPTSITPAAGATRLVTYIFFGVPGRPNTLDLASKEEGDLELRFGSDMTTRFGANAVTYEIYGYSAPSIAEQYELNVSKQNIQAAGAGREKEPLNRKNIAALYLRDDGDVIDQIQLIVDGETVEDNVTDDDLRDIANLLNQVESAQDLAEINLMPSGNILEASNEYAEIEANFSGAGTLDLVVFSINFDSPGIQRSRTAVEARQRSKIARLQSQGAGIIQGVPSGAVRNPNRN